MGIERTENGKCYASIDGKRVEITRRLANKAVRLNLSEQEVAKRHAANENRQTPGRKRRY